MIVRPTLDVSRRRFIQQSSIVAGGAALVGAMGLSSEANAIPGNDYPSNAGLALLDPSTEHWRKEYCWRAREIFRELGTVLADKPDEPFPSAILSPKAKSIEDPGSAYRHLLRTCRQLLEKGLDNGGDNSVLFWLSVNLRRCKYVAPAHDAHVAAVMRAWDNVQRVYFLDESTFTRARPTILFIHGSGIGPFPVFNGLFKEFSRDCNVAFMLYDHLEPIADIARRLNSGWAAFRKEHRPAEPLRIISLSYGTSILRYAVLTDNEGLWQGSSLVEIAPVVLGSKYMNWLNAVPMQMFVLRLAVPNLKHWASGVDGKDPPQQTIWAPQGITCFDKVIKQRLSLVPERDQHLSSEARRHLKDLLGDGKFVVIKGARHDPAPGLKEVIFQTRRFLESSDRATGPTAS
jgi:hypothetical protein